MPVSMEFRDFVSRWLGKAHQIPLTDLTSHFDRFFTLYVVYNRLYAEAAFILARQEQSKLDSRETFPDSKAATCYICKFLGARTLVDAVESDVSTRHALDTVRQFIHEETFSIMLHRVTGDPQREKDLELLSELESSNSEQKAKAILKTIYAVRCNMFHGHKEFRPVQSEILSPVIVILEKLISLLQGRLARE